MNRKRTYIIALLLILSTVLIFFIVTKTTLSTKPEPFESFIFQTNTGFGYSIKYNNKLLIKQGYIPTIQNNQSFCTYQDAEAVANLVLEKLIKKENPSITISELKQLGIKLNCIN